MTLEKAIQRLKDVREYTEWEIALYAQMAVDVNPRIEDAQALDAAIEALERMRRQDTGCDFCRRHTLEDPVTNDFRVMDNVLFFNDSQFGWEGTMISYCPQCERKLPVVV